MKISKELNKWQISIGFVRVWEVLPKAWRFRFAIFNLTSLPEIGSFLEKKNYKGVFWQSGIIWHPFTHIKNWLNSRGQY